MENKNVKNGADYRGLRCQDFERSKDYHDFCVKKKICVVRSAESEYLTMISQIPEPKNKNHSFGGTVDAGRLGLNNQHVIMKRTSSLR